MVASTIFLVSVSQASATTQANACVNNVDTSQANSIPVTMTATASPNPVEPGEQVTLSEIHQELAIPSPIFLAGYNLALLTEGENKIPVTVETRIVGTNTFEGEQIVIAEGVIETTITGPPGSATATPGTADLSYPSITWTADTAGPIEFREKTQEPLTYESAGILIVAKLGPITVKFGCDPGNVEEEAAPSTIALETAAPFASAEVVAPPEPSYALNLTTSGSGVGSFRCDTGSGPEACASEYVEGTEVEVIAEPGAGSEFAGFSGDCTGSSCELTINEPHSVDARFDLSATLGGTTQANACLNNLVVSQSNSMPAHRP